MKDNANININRTTSTEENKGGSKMNKKTERILKLGQKLVNVGNFIHNLFAFALIAKEVSMDTSKVGELVKYKEDVTGIPEVTKTCIFKIVDFDRVNNKIVANILATKDPLMVTSVNPVMQVFVDPDKLRYVGIEEYKEFFVNETETIEDSLGGPMPTTGDFKIQFRNGDIIKSEGGVLYCNYNPSRELEEIKEPEKIKAYAAIAQAKQEADAKGDVFSQRNFILSSKECECLRVDYAETAKVVAAAQLKRFHGDDPGANLSMRTLNNLAYKMCNPQVLEGYDPENPHSAMRLMRAQYHNMFEVSDAPNVIKAMNKLNPEVDSTPEFDAILYAFSRFETDHMINKRLKVYYGEPGTGKTTKAEEEARADGGPLLKMSCTASMMPEDLTAVFDFSHGETDAAMEALKNAVDAASSLWSKDVIKALAHLFITAIKDGKPKYAYTAFTIGAKTGRKVVMDEINLTTREFLFGLQSYTDDCPEIVTSKGEVIPIKEGFQVIATMNLHKMGQTLGIGEALADRCVEVKKFELSDEMIVKAF